jgi:SAM-dependent methyltransferase
VKVCLACEARFDSAGWTCPECGRAPAQNGFLRFTAGEAEALDGFPDTSFDHLPEQEQRSFWFRGRNRLIDWALRKYFPEASSFFELGCGTGVVLAALRARGPELTFAGGEPSAAGLEIARSRLPDVPLYQLDGRRLPFEEEFDVVGAFDVLEHIDEDGAVLAQMHQAVKPGGGILLSVPQHPWLWSPVDDYSLHRRRYTARELVERLEVAGFQVVRKTSFVSLLLPAVAFSRWRGRGRKTCDPMEEHRLPRVVERLFGAAMSAERRLIALGVSFPAGSSLLLAARRR